MYSLGKSDAMLLENRGKYLLQFSLQRDVSRLGKNDFHIGVFAYELRNAT